MSNQKLLAVSALAMLSAAAVCTLPQAHAAGQEGMVVVRDPETGQLRAPNANEARTLLGNATLQRKAQAPRVLGVGPGGGHKVQLGKSGLVYSVVTRGADGQLAEQCVNDQDAAHAAMHATAAPKEPRHDSE